MISPIPKTALSFLTRKKTIIFLQLNKYKQILDSESEFLIYWLWYFSAATGKWHQWLGFQWDYRNWANSERSNSTNMELLQAFREQRRLLLLKLISFIQRGRNRIWYRPSKYYYSYVKLQNETDSSSFNHPLTMHISLRFSSSWLFYLSKEHWFQVLHILALVVSQR